MNHKHRRILKLLRVLNGHGAQSVKSKESKSKSINFDYPGIDYKGIVIDNYRKLYRITTRPSISKSIIKLPKLFGLVLISLSLVTMSCKEKKQVKIEIKKETKVAPKEGAINQISDEKVILFYGNSLTAGYGLDPSESFPSNIENIVDSLGLKYKVVNAGLSGETTSGGLKRIDWVMKQKVDIFILELGANDMLRGLPLPETKKNLAKIIETVKSKNPDVKIGLCEMMAPPNMGDDYVTSFTQIYKELSAPNDITFVPFFLDGVAGHPDLMLQDGKHPNANGQKIVAKNVWKVLKGML